MSQKLDQATPKVAYTGVIPRTPWRFIWHVSRPSLWWVVFAVATVVVATVIEKGSYYLMKMIVDAATAHNLQLAVTLGFVYPFLIFMSQVLWRVSSYTGMRWTTAAIAQTYATLVPYVLNHSHGYFSDRFAGSVLTKTSNVTGAVDQLIHDILWSHLYTVISLTITLVLLLQIDVFSAVLFVALIIILIILNQRLAKKKQAYSRVAAAKSSALRGHIVDMFTNMVTVRQYAAVRQETLFLGEKVSQDREAREQSWKFTDRMLLVNVTILFLFTLGMFYSLIARFGAAEISLGDFVLVLSLITSLAGTLVFIGRAFNHTAKAFGEAEEGLNDLLLPHEIADDQFASMLSVDKGEIEFKSVNFVYGEHAVFTRLDLSIPPGQRLGLVGPSGAGKSTFVSLLLRQHDVTKGAILIDGQNIAEVTQDSLRANIAVVPQEPMLFHRSIRENIAYGKPDATEEEIIAVAKKAQAHDFISALPEGYDTLVGERGVKLSGGQKQRIAIARAMLKNAPILVLDEATSALDSESEVAIQRALHELMEGKTVVAIAHRLSTLREMDRIIVLDGGRIVEDGTHDTLAKAGGTYARLWEHQAGGFLQE